MALCARQLRRQRALVLLLLLGLLGAIGPKLEADARFDLIGPRVEVRVTRGGKMLPIASVPNLQPGDQVWLHPDLPPSQSVRYLLVVVFLRGTTNPPPDSWFRRIETWDRHVREEGVTVTVPPEAQQALLFLAPETGGDFSTLRSAVRGRPGIFVRASQDLAEAGFEQSRIEKYLAAIKQVPPSDPKALLDHSQLLARTLNLKPNEDCFKRSPDMQYTCLTQSGNQSLLEDGHGQTIVSTLTNGPSTDLIYAASSTPLAGGGAYSAYVGAVVDVVRLLSGLHTAHYQYIPAIAFPERENLNLRLNTPPSFLNPKSVIVIGLPAVQAATLPPLRPANPGHVSCLLRPDVIFPVDGAPLVFSTALAHDMVLHVNGRPELSEIPLRADAYQGGLVPAAEEARRVLPDPGPEGAPKPAGAEARSGAEVVKGAVEPGKGPVDSGKGAKGPDPGGAGAAKLPATTDATATVEGFWGFDHFTGPTLPVQIAPGGGWKLKSAGDNNDQVIAGVDNHLDLTGDGTACIQSVTSPNADKTEWKPAAETKPMDVSVTVRPVRPGKLELAVHQYGTTRVDLVTAQAFSKPAELKSVTFHAGDRRLLLQGANLGDVRSLDLDGTSFSPVVEESGDQAPAGSVAAAGLGSLYLAATAGAAAPKLKAGESATAKVNLGDGRVLSLPLVVEPTRPVVSILSRTVEQTPVSTIRLGNKDDLPLDGHLKVSLRSTVPFARDAHVEVEDAGSGQSVSAALGDGSLVLEDKRTVVLAVDLRKSFGPSAFGPLRLRMVAHDGTAGDWIPLGNLVRVPSLTGVRCGADAAKPCTLTGANLFLLNAVAADAAFTDAVMVPEGYVEDAIEMPRPANGSFFVRLRDDPTAVDVATLPVTSR